MNQMLLGLIPIAIGTGEYVDANFKEKLTIYLVGVFCFTKLCNEYKISSIKK